MTGAPALLGLFFVAALVATGLVLRWLRAKQILDLPNARSSHTIPTPRGGGLAVTPLIIAGLAVWFLRNGANLADWTMLAGAAGLALISWLDDRITLPALPRFAFQALAVAGVLCLMPESRITHGTLTSIEEKIFLGFAWVWFVNLYNFMDGIDGITGVETISIALGLLFVAPAAVPAAILAIVAGSVLGFLVWNWHPAKIFMGDVGSIPLGFILGYLLLTAIPAVPNGWTVALALPALYWTDATITLIRRGLAGKPVWQAHREHFYQRATQGGWSHARVSVLLALGNAGLIGMARIATVRPELGLAGAAVATALILGLFQAKYLQKDGN